MTSLEPEAAAYGVVLLVALVALVAAISDLSHMKRPLPRSATMFLAFSLSLTISAVAIFLAAYLRLRSGGVLQPEQGVALRSGIEGGIVGALITTFWWRFLH